MNVSLRASLVEDDPGRKRQGVALVLVLSFLVIISGLIIAFFSMVTSEASSAGTTAAAASAKSLSDSAVSYVMGTIVDATLGRDPGDDSASGPAHAWVWTSQPGMIRTFDNAGAPKFVYKLYSADDMKPAAAALGSPETAGLASWATGGNRDVWVDMNEPAKNSLGDDVYPIVDPRAAEDYDQTGFPGHDDSPTVLGGSSGQEINPNAAKRRVEGFHVLKHGNVSATTDPNAPLYDANDNNPAPMPVKWLYVLQDGTLTTAQFDGTDAVLNGNGPSALNPIKGRIAFWTDDESSKVNINTASEGTYWDVPRFNSMQETGNLVTRTFNNVVGPQAASGGNGFALVQPAKGEYQRYPGHPATTSLSPIFGYAGSSGGLAPVLPVPRSAANHLYTSLDAAQIEKYYSLTPRILPGGSTVATKVSSGTLPPTDPSTGKIIQPGQGRYYRLYSTVDELLFDALDPTLTGGAGDVVHRIPNVYTTVGTNIKQSVITPDMMQKAKFFLTANSSAPEVTLYNTPRMSMWPVNLTDANHVSPNLGRPLKTTAYDELAKFCATVGPSLPSGAQNSNIYYFTRFNARSQTDDFPKGGRNDVLYQYLQKLTSLPVPGNTFGNTFLKKYATGVNAPERDQILTEIYDYIRCTNIQDSTPDPDHPVSPNALPSNDPVTYPYRYTPIDVVMGNNFDNSTASMPGAGEVLPIRIGATQGFGRVDTIASAYLLFFAAHDYPYSTTASRDNDKPYVPQPPGAPIIPEAAESGGNGISMAPGPTDAMGVVFMLSFTDVMQGNVGNRPKLAYRVTGLDQLTFTSGAFIPVNPAGGAPVAGHTFVGSPLPGGGVSTSSVLPPGPLVNYIESGDVRTWHGRGIGGTVSPYLGFSNGTWGRVPDNIYKKCNSNSTSSRGNYPFYGYTDQIPVPAVNKMYMPDTAGTPTKNQYYPNNFSLHQGPKDITVEIITPEVAAGTSTDGPIQTFSLRFPDGVFHLPYPVPNYTKTGGFNFDLNLTTGPQLAYQNQGTEFFFNKRLEYQDIATYPGNMSGGTSLDEPTQGQFIPNRWSPGTDNFVMYTDTVVSLEPAGYNYTGSIADTTPDHTAGDHRVYAALPIVPPPLQQPVTRYFQPNFNYGLAMNDLGSPNAPQMAHNMMRSVSGPTNEVAKSIIYHGFNPVAGPNPKDPSLGKLINTAVIYSRSPDVPRRVGAPFGNKSGTGSYVTRVDGGPGSWDTGMGMHKDGDYINKPDEGDQNFIRYDNNNIRQYRVPYVDTEDYTNNSGTFFSPNRQIPSSMMFGSLPTGVQRHLPWQTLLFHPPVSGDANNEGGMAPADHYLADLFWMPVVEPYAISQPFSTAGKINLNYQIQPFTYIKRTTGMRALMKSTRMAAISPGLASLYKPPFATSGQPTLPQDVRFPIRLDSTMTMLDKKFDVDHDVYRSATEISTIPLIPNDPALSLSGLEDYETLAGKMATYWGNGTSPTANHQLTGNNLRDKPYADLYGRLTTKSNVFTVHVRAQALRKAPNTPATKWVSGKDQVVAEYRGSSIIERYIDANDLLLPDFAVQTISDPGSANLNIDQYYKFRIVSTKRFAP